MEFRILGPLEARDGTEHLQLGGRKQRALLARLLLDANRSLAVERLIDDLWEQAAPDSARKMVQIYVSQLRKVLPAGILVTQPPGYAIRVGDDELDLHRFEHLVAEGREALAGRDAELASRRLHDALALWRGPALVEFSEPFARPEAVRLEELRLACVEERIDADLALGRHAELVPELELLTGHNPLRERLRAQLVHALYRSGRQADALNAYRAYRRMLDDQLGIEPSAELRELEGRILRQDPRLEAPRPSVQPDAAVDRSDDHQIGRARSGDVGIAYQVVGDGPLDLVLVHGWVCTFEPGWEHPKIARFYRRLASMGRLILFDKRGTGLSDRVQPEHPPDLETRMDDLRAVMDAAGSERAVVLGVSEGGPMSVLFAATYPERTLGLVLMGTFARQLWATDYPIGLTEQEIERRLSVTEEDDWADATTREWLLRAAPAAVEDEGAVRWYVSYVKRGADPAAARALRRMNAEIDVRHVLPTIGVPTLVLYRAGEHYAEGSRYLGERIAGAAVVSLTGNDHLPWEGDQDALLGEVEGFVTGVTEELALDRVLVTVLFADLVGSTAKAAALGDRAWRELLERYHGVVRTHVARFRGREVETAGDGVFAVFDGPARAVRCAGAIEREVRRLGLQVRCGLHTGEVELVDGRVHGIAVHIGARVAAQAGPGEVLVSQTVTDLVAGSGLEFEDRGIRALDGVPGEWRLLAVTPASDSRTAATSPSAS